MLKQLVFAASLAAVVWPRFRFSAEIVEQVLVKVNGEIITKTEFEARQVAEFVAVPSWPRPLPEMLSYGVSSRRSHPTSS